MYGGSGSTSTTALHIAVQSSPSSLSGEDKGLTHSLTHLSTSTIDLRNHIAVQSSPVHPPSPAKTKTLLIHSLTPLPLPPPYGTILQSSPVHPPSPAKTKTKASLTHSPHDDHEHGDVDRDEHARKGVRAVQKHFQPAAVGRLRPQERLQSQSRRVGHQHLLTPINAPTRGIWSIFL